MDLEYTNISNVLKNCPYLFGLVGDPYNPIGWILSNTLEYTSCSGPESMDWGVTQDIGSCRGWDSHMYVGIVGLIDHWGWLKDGAPICSTSRNSSHFYFTGILPSTILTMENLPYKHPFLDIFPVKHRDDPAPYWPYFDYQYGPEWRIGSDPNGSQESVKTSKMAASISSWKWPYYQCCFAKKIPRIRQRGLSRKSSSLCLGVTRFIWVLPCPTHVESWWL